MALRVLSQSFLRTRLATPVLPMSHMLMHRNWYGTKKYTESHEWIEVNDSEATIGITDYAQNALGDIVYVEVPEVDSEVEIEDVVGVVESVKSTSDIYTPLTGTITAANENVVGNTKLLNQKPETEGWLFKIKFTDQAQVDALLDEAAYKKLTEESH